VTDESHARRRAAASFALAAAILLNWQSAATAQAANHPPLPLRWEAEDYREALARFPDLDACKKAGFLNEEIGFFELHKVFRTGEELELCHYWLFRTADNVKQAVMDYLQNIEGVNASMTRPYGNSGLVTINGLWSTKECGVPYGSWLLRKYITSIVYLGEITVVVDDKNRIFRIRINFSAK